jgi:hypothetical protein
MFEWSRWQRHFSDESDARRWYALVPDPLVAADWYFVGVRDPVEAAEWIRLHKTPQTVRGWRSSGFSDVGEILRWIQIGQTVDSAKRWIEIGCDTPESAGEWVSLGQTPESLLAWFELGLQSTDELAVLSAEGLTLEIADGLDIKEIPDGGWKKWTQLTTQGDVARPKVINAWLAEKPHLAEATPWVDVGATPFEREFLLFNGVSLEMLQKLSVSSCAELVGQFDGRHRDLEQWIFHGFKYDDMMKWKDAGASIEEVLDWRAIEVPDDHARMMSALGFTAVEYLECLGSPLIEESNLVRWRVSGLPLRSIKLFVLGGIPDPETAQKWMEGFGRDPNLAVSEYASFHGDFRRARAARRKLEQLRQSPPETPPTVELQRTEDFRASATRKLEASQRRQLPNVKLPNASEEWLEEVVAWARTLQDRLRKGVESPAVVFLENLQLEIRIRLTSDLIKGSLKAGGRSFDCQIDLLSFEPISSTSTSDQRFVLGLCLCWFIDCSIVISGQSRGAPELFKVSGDKSGKSQTVVRYVPTPRFSTRRSARPAVEAVGLRIRHQVSGHIRALPLGHRGSEEARDSAPGHIRRIMKANETYVQPHFRGTEELKRELEVRLSRYSALGEALSDLSWN